MDEVVQRIQALGVKLSGGGDPLALGIAEKIGGVPLRIQLVEADNVAAGLGQTACAFGGVVLVGEAVW